MVILAKHGDIVVQCSALKQEVVGSGPRTRHFTLHKEQERGGSVSTCLKIVG